MWLTEDGWLTDCDSKRALNNCLFLGWFFFKLNRHHLFKKRAYKILNVLLSCSYGAFYDTCFSQHFSTSPLINTWWWHTKTQSKAKAFSRQNTLRARGMGKCIKLSHVLTVIFTHTVLDIIQIPYSHSWYYASCYLVGKLSSFLHSSGILTWTAGSY